MTAFDGSVVWITGGGTGIGREMALEFGRRGASVVVVSGRRQDRLDEVVAQLGALGQQGMAVVCDVCEDDQIRAAVALIVESHGKLDVVVANAGYGVAGRVHDLTADDWRRQFEVNVVGCAMTVTHALPELEKTGGRIALIGSVAAFANPPKNAAYNASKAAVASFGATLSAELANSSVTCTTVHPGFVKSEIAQVDNQGVHHADREDRRPSRLMWETDRAAKVIVRAIGKRKREFVFTGHGKFGAFIGRHFPGFTHIMMSKTAPKAHSDGTPAAPTES